jgi:EmrB/QacA subfamily drug resistance transporter
MNLTDELDNRTRQQNSTTRTHKDTKRIVMTENTATANPAAPHTAEADNHGHRHLGLALTLICTAQLMVVLDASVVNIALPHIKGALDFSQQNLQWVVTGYTLSFGGLLLLGGRSGDLLGRRRMFIIGVLLFAAASGLGGAAQNESWLIVARLLQGVGAAIASPTALSLITTTFPPGPPRNRAFAVYAAMSGAGAAIGLILGGALTQIHTTNHDFGWRLTLLINVPIGLFVAFLAPRVLAESTPQRGIGLDLPGALTATGGLASLVYGLTHAAGNATSSNWGQAQTWLWIGLGVALIASFLVIESRTEQPLLPLHIIKHRSRGVSYTAMGIVGAGMFAMFFFISLFVQQVLGYSSIKAGVAFLPFTLGIVVSAQTASTLAARVDPRWITGLGGILAGSGMLWFSRLSVDSSYAGGLLPGIILMSLGMGLIFVPFTLTAVHGVVKEESGIASAVLNTTQQVGGALGLAVLSTVAFGATRGKIIDLATSGSAPSAHVQLTALTYGFTRAFLVAGAMIFAAAVIAVVGLAIKHEELATDTDEPVLVGA